MKISNVTYPDGTYSAIGILYRLNERYRQGKIFFDPNTNDNLIITTDEKTFDIQSIIDSPMLCSVMQDCMDFVSKKENIPLSIFSIWDDLNEEDRELGRKYGQYTAHWSLCVDEYVTCWRVMDKYPQIIEAIYNVPKFAQQYLVDAVAAINAPVAKIVETINFLLNSSESWFIHDFEEFDDDDDNDDLDSDIEYSFNRKVNEIGTEGFIEMVSVVLPYIDKPIIKYLYQGAEWAYIYRAVTIHKTDLARATCKTKIIKDNVYSCMDYKHYPSEIRKMLEDKFMTKYGRVPKIIDAITAYVQYYSVDYSAIVERFDVRKVRRLLKAGVSPFTAIWAMHNNMDNPSELWDILACYNCSESLAKALIKQKGLSIEKVAYILRYADFSKNYSDLNSEQIIQKIRNVRAEKEVQKIESIYNINFTDLTTSISFCDAEVGGMYARILSPTDPKQAILGYDTHCCQRLGEAGVTAMMYGLMAENGGFWAVDNQGQTIAQAELWIAKNGYLVFDNIELSDNKDLTTIENVLKVWLSHSGYQDIVMGTGYNVLKYDNMEYVTEEIVQPICIELENRLNDQTLFYDGTDAIADDEDDEDDEDYESDVYTDTRAGIVWLKKSGKIML